MRNKQNSKQLTDLEIAIKLEEIEKEETMKQTAVDYLFEKLWGIHKDKFTWQMILKEAKKKHKKEIIEAFKAGAFYSGFELEAEMYYWENYGKNA